MKKSIFLLSIAMALVGCGGQQPSISSPSSSISSGENVSTISSIESTSEATSSSSIVKQDFEGITFEDVTLDYDGEPHTIEAKGIPSFASVHYYDNGPFTDAGTYPMTAVVSAENYNDLTLVATLTINRGQIGSMSFEDGVFEYDGEPHSIEVSGVPEGANVIYTSNVEGIDNTAVDIGEYNITATVKKRNYFDVVLHAKLTIIPSESFQIFTIHTELQNEFLESESNALPSGVNGSAELSLPKPISLVAEQSPECSPEDVTSYVLTISETPDFSYPLVYTSGDNTFDVYNLKINTKYYYTTTNVTVENNYESDVKNFIIRENYIRNIKLDGVTNARDLGGWNIGGGKSVQQGLVYRTGRLHQNNQKFITDEGIKAAKKLHIRTEIELRNSPDGNNVFSSAIPNVQYVNCPMEYEKVMEDTSNYESIKTAIDTFADLANYPIIFHCAIGTDRTGFISFLLNGLAGVSEAGLIKDYLFSNYGNIGSSRNDQAIRNYINLINSRYDCADGLSGGIANYLVNTIGVSRENVNKVKSILTGETKFDAYEHVEAENWTPLDGDYHHKACAKCDLTYEIEEHTFDVFSASTDVIGYEEKTCSKCGYHSDEHDAEHLMDNDDIVWPDNTYGATVTPQVEGSTWVGLSDGYPGQLCMLFGDDNVTRNFNISLPRVNFLAYSTVIFDIYIGSGWFNMGPSSGNVTDMRDHENTRLTVQNRGGVYKATFTAFCDGVSQDGIPTYLTTELSDDDILNGTKGFVLYAEGVANEERMIGIKGVSVKDVCEHDYQYVTEGVIGTSYQYCTICGDEGDSSLVRTTQSEDVNYSFDTFGAKVEVCVTGDTYEELPNGVAGGSTSLSYNYSSTYKKYRISLPKVDFSKYQEVEFAFVANSYYGYAFSPCWKDPGGHRDDASCGTSKNGKIVITNDGDNNLNAKLYADSTLIDSKSFTSPDVYVGNDSVFFYLGFSESGSSLLRVLTPTLSVK